MICAMLCASFQSSASSRVHTHPNPQTLNLAVSRTAVTLENLEACNLDCPGMMAKICVVWSLRDGDKIHLRWFLSLPLKEELSVGVSQKWGYHFGVSHNKGKNILGSILGPHVYGHYVFEQMPIAIPFTVLRLTPGSPFSSIQGVASGCCSQLVPLQGYKPTCLPMHTCPKPYFSINPI